MFKKLADTEMTRLKAVSNLDDESDGPDIVAARVARRVFGIVSALTVQQVNDDRLADEIALDVLRSWPNDSDFSFPDLLVETAKAAWESGMHRTGLSEGTTIGELYRARPFANLYPEI